jgi:hypothetical protein
MSYSKCACGQGNKCQWLGSGLDISKSAHRCSYMYTDNFRCDHRVSGLCLQEEEKTFICCHCKENIKKAEANPDDSDEDFIFSNATIKTTINKLKTNKKASSGSILTASTDDISKLTFLLFYFYVTTSLFIILFYTVFIVILT